MLTVALYAAKSADATAKAAHACVWLHQEKLIL